MHIIYEYIDGLMQGWRNSIAGVMHWSYVFLALTHRYDPMGLTDNKPLICSSELAHSMFKLVIYSAQNITQTRNLWLI